MRLAALRSQRGDMEAVHFLYTRFASDVHSSIRDLVPDGHEARMATERVFHELPTLMADYELDKQVFACWLRNAARDVVQEQRHLSS